MSIDKIYRLLSAGKKYIKINQDLLNVLSLDEALLYSFIVPEYQRSIKNDEYRYFEDKIYYSCSIEEIESILGFSAFKQRNILNKLQKRGLLKVKLGQAKMRYIWVNDDETIIEKILLGNPLDKIKKEFNRFIKEQIQKFNETQNNKIDNQTLKYFAENSEIYNQLVQSWLSQINNIDETNKEEICLALK